MNAPAASITQADMGNNGVSVVIGSASKFAKELEEGGLWTAQRLKHAVRHLQGVSNSSRSTRSAVDPSRHGRRN
jgi:hypothetical protein